MKSTYIPRHILLRANQRMQSGEAYPRVDLRLSGEEIRRAINLAAKRVLRPSPVVAD